MEDIAQEEGKLSAALASVGAGDEVGLLMAGREVVIADLLGATASVVLAGVVEQGTDEQLAIVEQGQGSAFEEVHLMSAGVEQDEAALAVSDAEHEDAVEAVPKSIHLAVGAAEVLAGVLLDVEQALDAEGLIGGEVEEELAAPAESDAADGACVLEPLDGGADGRGDGGWHGQAS